MIQTISRQYIFTVPIVAKVNQGKFSPRRYIRGLSVTVKTVNISSTQIFTLYSKLLQLSQYPLISIQVGSSGLVLETTELVEEK